MSIEYIPVTTADGVEFSLAHYRAKQTNGYTVLIHPAMSIEAAYYAKMAEALAALGCHVVLADLRGIGHCSADPERGDDFGYKEMIEYDLAAFVVATRQRHPESKLVLLGNSLGGQMATLYAATHANEIHAVVLIGAGSVYHKTFAKPASVLFGTQFLSSLGAVMGYVPGRWFGFADVAAKTMVYDWARQSRSGVYRAKGSTVNYEKALAETTVPVLCYSLAGDGFAPRKAGAHLLSKMCSNYQEHHYLKPADLGLDKFGHYTWAKTPEPFAQQVVAWLQEMKAYRVAA